MSISRYNRYITPEDSPHPLPLFLNISQPVSALTALFFVIVWFTGGRVVAQWENEFGMCLRDLSSAN